MALILMAILSLKPVAWTEGDKTFLVYHTDIPRLVELKETQQ